MHEGIKERYLRKSHYFTIVGQSFMKMVADRHEQLSMLSVTTNTSDELFSRINIDDFESP